MEKIPKTHSIFAFAGWTSGGKVFVTKPFATLQGEFPGQSLRCRIFFVASRAEAEFRMFASTSTIFGRFGAEPSGSWKGCLDGHTLLTWELFQRPPL